MNMVLRWWTGRFYMLRPRNMVGHSTCESSMSTLVRPARAQILVSSLDSANRGLAGGLLTRNLTSSNEYPAFLAAGKTKIPAIRADPSSWYSSGKCLAPWRNSRKNIGQVDKPLNRCWWLKGRRGIRPRLFSLNAEWKILMGNPLVNNFRKSTDIYVLYMFSSNSWHRMSAY